LKVCYFSVILTQSNSVTYKIILFFKKLPIFKAKKWVSSKLLTKGESEREKLLMGLGGAYSSDDLAVRINMFEGIEAEIDLIKYDLKRLQQELILNK